MKRCFRVDAERFLTAADARKAIAALKQMKACAARPLNPTLEPDP